MVRHQLVQRIVRAYDSYGRAQQQLPLPIGDTALPDAEPRGPAACADSAKATVSAGKEANAIPSSAGAIQPLLMLFLHDDQHRTPKYTLHLQPLESDAHLDAAALAIACIGLVAGLRLRRSSRTSHPAATAFAKVEALLERRVQRRKRLRSRPCEVGRLRPAASGYGNNELETYTSRPANVAAARRQSRHHGAKRRLHRRRRHRPPLHLGRIRTQGPVFAGLWTLRGEHQAAARQRHLAGLLAARRRHRHRRLAEVRRDRHLRKYRRALHHLQHPARARLQRRARHLGKVRAARRRGRQYRLPSLRRGVGAQRHQVLSSTTSSSPSALRPIFRREQPGSTIIRSSSF